MVTVYVGITTINSSSINIYPNPVHDLLTIGLPSSMTSQEKLLKLCDVTGRIVFSETINETGLHTISVSSLAKGVYILTIESREEKRMVRVIVD